jgi:hypothetical protein
MAISCRGAHFPQDIIRMGVRWYVAYQLSTRHKCVFEAIPLLSRKLTNFAKLGSVPQLP